VPTAEAPRVLIVEDDLSLAELYALYLRAIGLDVRVAVDGLVADDATSSTAGHANTYSP
jgi:DNA-binding response OmpR family regulator